MLVTLSVLVALQVVLTRFCSFNAWNVRIGFGFTALVIAAIFYGPVAAALVGGLGDFIGSIAFPTGSYFPGFTLTQVLMGLVFGFALYKGTGMMSVLTKKNVSDDSSLKSPISLWFSNASISRIFRIVPAVLVNQCLFSLLLNTLWISVLYGSSFSGLLGTRALQAAVTAPVQMITIYVLQGILGRADIRNVIVGAN